MTREPGRVVMGFVSWTALSVLMIGPLLGETHDSLPTRAYVLVPIVLVAFTAGAPLVIRRPFDWFEFLNVFVFFYVVGYVIRPLVLLFNPEQGAFGGFWEWSETGSGTYCVTLGLAAFLAGYHSPWGARLGMLAPRLHPSVEPMWATVTFFCMIGLSIGAYVVHAWLLGGLDVFVEGLFSDRSGMYYGFGWLVPLQNLGLVAIPFGYAYLLTERRLRLTFFAGALVIVGLLLIPMSRGVFLMWIVMLLAYRHYAVRPIRLWHLIIVTVGCIAILVGLQFSREWRFGAVQEFAPVEALLYTYSTTFNGFDTLMMVLSYYDDPHNRWYGQTLFEALAYPWIPRAIWTAKPFVYGGTAITEPIGSFFTGGTHVNAEVLGELFANFGFAGVAVGMWLLGSAGRALYTACCAGERRNKATLLFYAYVVAMVPGWQRVGVGATAYYFLTFIGPFAVVLWLLHRRSRRIEIERRDSLGWQRTTA